MGDLCPIVKIKDFIFIENLAAGHLSRAREEALVLLDTEATN